MDVYRFLQKCFRRYTGRTALEIAGSKSLSFNDLEAEIKNLASVMQNELDLEAGDRVALLTENSVEGIVLLLSCWYSGIGVAEIKPHTSSETLSYYIGDWEPDGLFYSGDLKETVDNADISVTREKIRLEDMEYSAYSGIRHPGDLSREIATLSYTSGTTGRPKGVPYTHERLLYNVMVLRIRGEIRGDDNVCLLYPYYGVGSLEVLASLRSGAKLVLPYSKKPEDVLRCVEAYDITSMGGVPTQLKALAETAETNTYDTSSLRYIHTGSGLMTTTVHTKVRDQLCDTICTSYGSMEAGETLYSLDDSVSLGRPTCFQKVRLVESGYKDPDRIVNGEGTGELVVKMTGPQVFDGYWMKPRKTEESVVDGWYFTGDILRRDADGRFWFEGRSDDMIISGGENIPPGEIEDVLLTHQSVKHAGAVGVDDEHWGQKVVGFVETHREVSEEELDRYCRESSLENIKRPKEYFFVDNIPMNNTGGVERRKLRERYQNPDS